MLYKINVVYVCFHLFPLKYMLAGVNVMVVTVMTTNLINFLYIIFDIIFI